MPDTNCGCMVTALVPREGELALARFRKQWRVSGDAVNEILSEGSQQ